MTKPVHVAIAEVAGVDLDFRPASYWEADDPTSLIVQNMKGQLRRDMARDFLSGSAPDELGDIQSDLLEDTLSDAMRRDLGQLGPSWMGGEYLPDYARGEVEIARIVLASVTMDVYSIRARRTPRGNRITYRLVDEYQSDWNSARKSSARPLTLRQLVELIDTADSSECDSTYPLIENIVRFQMEGGETPEHAAAFVAVESTIYPALGRYYATRVLAWAQARAWKDDA
jgi:hypothetical protein